MDLDGDGDVDIASANELGDDVTIFFQTAPGVFDRLPLVLADSTALDSPGGLEAADLDGDGDADLVSANALSGSLTLFEQTAPGVYDPVPSVVGRAGYYG